MDSPKAHQGRELGLACQVFTLTWPPQWELLMKSSWESMHLLVFSCSHYNSCRYPISTPSRPGSHLALFSYVNKLIGVQCLGWMDLINAKTWVNISIGFDFNCVVDKGKHDPAVEGTAFHPSNQWCPYRRSMERQWGASLRSPSSYR